MTSNDTNCPLNTFPTRPLSGILIHDEFGSYSESPEDGISNAITKLQNVPTGSYALLDNGLIFVRKKLTALITERRKSDAETPLPALILEEFQNASMPVDDAVSHYSVIPSPFSVKTIAGGDFEIWHDELHAKVPGRFLTRPGLNSALSAILKDGFYGPLATHSYDGQAFEFEPAGDIQSLPVRPIIMRDAPMNQATYSLYSLADIGYAKSLDFLICETVFEEFKLTYLSWKNERHYLNEFVSSADNLWTIASNIASKTDELSHDLRESVDDDCMSYVQELRASYPELHFLSDSQIFNLNAQYQEDYCGMRYYDTQRCDTFLFFLLGKAYLFSRSADMDGKYIAYYILRGQNVDDAVCLAKDAIIYDDEISRQANIVRSRYSYANQNLPSRNLQSSPVLTFSDIFQMARSKPNSVD